MSKAKTKNPRTRRKPTPKQMEEFRARMAAREKEEEAYRTQMAEIKARISRLERLHEERKKQSKGEGVAT